MNPFQFVARMRAKAREHARRKQSLARHVSAGALKEALRLPLARDLTGETRTMSFLVCRLRKFDAMTNSYLADPAALSLLVRRAMTPLLATVHERQGAIGETRPDGFSAFFNAPLDDPAHAIHACECGLALLQDLEKTNRALDRIEQSDGTPMGPISIGIGIDTGDGIAGDFGANSRPDYAVASHAADRAGRLEAVSARYGAAILIGQATQALAEPNFATLEVDLIMEPDRKPAPLFALQGTPLSRANPRFLALKALHAQVFEAYRGQQWERAKTLIGQCRNLSGANPVLYDLYLDRIAQLEANPPGENWDGVFRASPL